MQDSRIFRFCGFKLVSLASKLQTDIHRHVNWQ